MTSPPIRISTPLRRRETDGWELSTEVSGLRGKRGSSDSRRIWIRFEDARDAWVSTRADAFLAAMLPTAMATGQDLHVEGAVSRRLLRGTRQIQALLRSWHPELHRVEIHAKEVVHGHETSGAVGSFFTGGIDSFHTALESLADDPESRRIDRLIYVEGFDLRLSEHALLASVGERLTAAAGELALPLLVARTNMREISDLHASWPDVQHGASLASIALALSPLFGEVRISSSDNYDTLVPYGSHPLLDPLWSNEATRIVHCGCEASRMAKIDWRISGSRVALRHLRVCWENRDGRYNCGECEKCIRTMICLRAAGVLERCTTFERGLDLAALERLGEADRVIAGYLPDVMRGLETSGRDPALLRALRDLSARFASPPAPPSTTWRRLRARVCTRLFRLRAAAIHHEEDHATH